MVAGGQRAEVQRLVEAAGGAVENEAVDGAAVDAEAQLRQCCAGGIRRAGEPCAIGQRDAFGQTGEAQGGGLGVQREASVEASALVAGGVLGQDRERVAAVLGAVEGERSGEVETALRVQRQSLRRTVVDAVLGGGDAGQVVEDLARERGVGVVCG